MSELSALSRRGLPRRIVDMDKLQAKIAVWTQERNFETVLINLALHHTA